ncbi:MAG TPA: glycosyltransferase N-terminal domain-containing protein, partial [Nitrospira sp.]|nr:glycosyltransferase N-terminal domain-containing protein [Nitrospira sp.]
MWKLLYNIGFLLATPVIMGVLLAKPRCRRGLAERFGLENGLFGLSRLFGAGERNQHDQPNKQNQPDKPVIWVHAVSLGEVVAAAPLVKALHERHPE